MKLKNAVAIVTGGSSGLGAATVKELVSNGCKVAVFDKNLIMDKSISAISNDKLTFFDVDVCEPESIKIAISALQQKWERIDINVNCAGVAIAEKTLGRNGPHSLDTFGKVVKVNLMAE